MGQSMKPHKIKSANERREKLDSSAIKNYNYIQPKIGESKAKWIIEKKSKFKKE